METKIFESPQTTLKKRVKKLQADIKDIDKNIIVVDFQAFVIACNPKYNTPEGMEFMRKVWYKTNSSVELTEILEQMRNVLSLKNESNG